MTIYPDQSGISGTPGESDAVLRNVRTLRMPPGRPENAEGLRSFFATLSPRSLHSRFFGICTPEDALRYAPAVVDYVHDFGVVGELGDEIVAVAHYFGSDQDRDVVTEACTYVIVPPAAEHS